MQKGDIIAFRRPLYCHYAMYIGDGKVIHKDNSNIFTDKRISTVCIQDVANVIGKVIIANSQYRNVVPLPFEDSLEKGLAKLGASDYNILTNNCEHFVTEIRYGRKMSYQIQKIAKTTIMILAGIAGIFL